MSLYTLTIEDPGTGVDWAFTVPGNYIYDVTGIVATLSTGGSALTVMNDSSGNGNNGFYAQLQPPWPTSVAGIVPGDRAVQFGDFANPIDDPQGLAAVNAAVVDWTAPWSVECFIDPPTFPFSGGYLFATGDGSAHSPIALVVDAVGRFELDLRTLGSPTATMWDASAFLAAGSYVTIEFDGANYVVTCDTNVLTQSGDPPGVPIGGDTDVLLAAAIPPTLATSITIDEFAIYPYALGATIRGNHYANRGDFAAYSAAVLGDGPSAYYHLDETSSGTGRTPSLYVNNGLNDVITVPDGFTATSAPGPYQYSWQTNLTSSTQTANGLLTTVAIPKLIVPAGYTIGVHTPDLDGGDSWSSVTLWWNSDYMDSLASINPYAYPPGALLTYQQRGQP